MTWNNCKHLATWLVVLALLPLLAGCGVYSFAGTNIDPAVKTFSVQTFQNTANNGPSYISQRFTEEFKDFYQRNTTLKLVPRDGDLQFEGQIIGFDFAPAAIQSTNGVTQAGQNNLTIQVRVRYTNTKDPKQDFEQTFQSNAIFNADQDPSSITNNPNSVRVPINNIIQDTFNKSVANW
ncbi:LptE family protein [Hymenobacter chitinivorans]|uniref:Lipopolysaccharide assembly protein n=1 Tax=Hymenobacter chitinivorans DSM 11115 TaxID=1121954 RepID=A0A2M9BRS7_9BACT|nr:LptE family protein [Hymenobacter chitinivorans]PJJ60631.1 lipopolysaccharide assembly protein [Hymenobacter chitinivorans DSM 11115]